MAKEWNPLIYSRNSVLRTKSQQREAMSLQIFNCSVYDTTLSTIRVYLTLPAVNCGTNQWPTRPSTVSNKIWKSGKWIGNSPQLLGYHGTTMRTTWRPPQHHLLNSPENSSSCIQNSSICIVPWSQKSNLLTKLPAQCSSSQCGSQWSPEQTQHGVRCPHFKYVILLGARIQ